MNFHGIFGFFFQEYIFVESNGLFVGDSFSKFMNTGIKTTRGVGGNTEVKVNFLYTLEIHI